MSRQNHQPIPLTGFPMMTTTEVCDCLAALCITASPEDLTKPTAATTQAIWNGLLYSLMAIPVDQFEGPKQSLLGMMQYRELYSDGLGFIMFYQHCRTLALLCGIRDFTIADLTRPEPTRLRTVMSGIMNFAKFRDERQRFHFEVAQRSQAEMDRAEELRRRLDSLDAAIGDMKAKSEADRPKMEEKQKRNKGIHNELLELRQQQMKLSAEVEELKRDRSRIMEDAAEKSRELAVLQQNTLSARSRFVRSPDRIKGQIRQMSEQLAAERSTHAGYVRSAAEHTKRNTIITGLEAELKRLIELEREIESQRGKAEAGRRRRTALRTQLEQVNIEQEAAKERQKQLDRQIKNAEDRLARQKEMAVEFREKATKKIQVLKEDYVVKSKDRNKSQKERDELLREQKVLEAEMAAFINESETNLNDLLQEYWAMRKQAEDYMNTMTVKLGLVMK
ncbi:kinetochore-associated Ndc80 complex subunit nuf2 [Vanrija albida]|uniref:Kinetochore-associated Ndc80 complex subunit nuf2 n=1 Tax=Vanrija albida TaxID=181172 RepID=A0ABR3Q5N5_9TREE